MQRSRHNKSREKRLKKPVTKSLAVLMTLETCSHCGCADKETFELHGKGGNSNNRLCGNLASAHGATSLCVHLAPTDALLLLVKDHIVIPHSRGTDDEACAATIGNAEAVLAGGSSRRVWKKILPT